MSVIYKRFAVFAAAVLMLIGVRLYDSGLSKFYSGGTFSVFIQNDRQIFLENPYELNVRGRYERIDFEGDSERAENFLKSACAKEVYTEEIDGIYIIYAYTPRLFMYVTLKGQKVNLMAAVNGKSVTIGYPIIKGSF